MIRIFNTDGPHMLPNDGERDAMGLIAGMRIGLVTASASRLGGGVFEAVATHARMLSSLDARPHVFALDDPWSEKDGGRFGSVPVSTCRVLGPRQVGYAPDLLGALVEAELDCLHLHGIWMYPSAAAARWAKVTGGPYLISPHGMLDPWITGRGRLKKAVARRGYERRSWARATAFHALTEREALDIARETRRNTIHVVPNAGPDPKEDWAVPFPEPLAVYIGRIHAKKNLSSLIDGWAAAHKPPGAKLLIAGWGDAAAVGELQRAIERGDGSAQFIGPVYDGDKYALLDRARFVVLPSLSEGLPMAVLEAWARGVPTIMSAACNLPIGFGRGAALECGTDSHAIGRALGQALALEERTWREMALAALDCARQQFSAGVIARTWETIYADACRTHGRSKPQ